MLLSIDALIISQRHIWVKLFEIPITYDCIIVRLFFHLHTKLDANRATSAKNNRSHKI